MLHDITVKAGQRIGYNIPIEAAPKPTAKWSINGKNIEPDNRVDFQVFINKITFDIPFSVRSDTGKYTLTLSNNLGQCTASANVTVLGTSQIIDFVIYIT